MSSKRLSVIIPTHNRSELLTRNLDAIASQSLERDRFEVIVVDDASSEEHRARIRALAPPFDFSLIEKEHGGLAAARNAGAAAASGDVLLFLDDDVAPHPRSFQAHLESHEEASDPVAVLGALPYPESWPLTTFLWYLEASTHFDLYKDPDKYAEGAPPLPPMNGNSSVARDQFNSTGRYDESFSRYGGEDLDLGYRLARDGVRFVYNPEAIGYHHHTKGFAQFRVDQERTGESVARLYRRYPEIKVPKKLDIFLDPFGALSARKKIVKLIMEATLRLPVVLILPRLLIATLGWCFPLRGLLYSSYRWVGHAHYAIGVRRGLENSA